MALEKHYRWGRAYRDGGLVVARAYLTILADAHVASGPPVPSQLRVRFVSGVHAELRCELEELVRDRRKRSAPINIVWDEPARGRHPASRPAHTGCLQAPSGLFVLLDEIDFRLRPVKPDERPRKRR